MKIEVVVYPSSKVEKIEEREKKYHIHIKEDPLQNKANLALIKLLRKHFKKPVFLLKGLKSKTKIFKIGEN